MMGEKRKKTRFRGQSPKNVFAKKSFGQNFLVDQNYIEKIISALNPQKEETIIEIGAGRGALTEKLLEKAGIVVAVELDKDLIPLLKERFGNYQNFNLIESDVLKLDFQVINTGKAKLVANLPYNISTAILQQLIEQRESFTEMILMFQREVVERITAKPASSERGFLTVLVEAHLQTEKLFDVPPTAFRPSPKVWSSVARLIKKENEELFIRNEDIFKELISQGFQQKRKTIFNNFKNASQKLLTLFENRGGIEKTFLAAGINSTDRAETLSIEQWISLANSLS